MNINNEFSYKPDIDEIMGRKNKTKGVKTALFGSVALLIILIIVGFL